MSIKCLEQENQPSLDSEASMRRSGPSGGLTARQEASGELIPLGDFTPAQTAHQLLDWLAAKSKISTDRLVMLGVLAGAFIAVGGAFFTGVMDVSSLRTWPVASTWRGGFLLRATACLCVRCRALDG